MILPNPFGHMVEAGEKNNISKTKHDPMVAARDMTDRAYRLL